MKVSNQKAYLFLKSLLKYSNHITLETGTNGITWILLYLSNLPTLIWYEEGKYRISFPESYRGVGYPQALCRSSKPSTILRRLQTYIKHGHSAAFKEELNARADAPKSSFITLPQLKARMKRLKPKPLCFPPIVAKLVKAPKRTSYLD